MNYKARSGVVLTEICGKYYLIASYEARKYCPGISEINSTGAQIWKMIIARMNETEIEKTIAGEYETANINLQESVEAYITSLAESGYLLGGEK